MLIEGKRYVIRTPMKDFHCAMDITMHFVGGKWKTVVLWYLKEGKKRFKDFKERMPDITDKMLSLQLKALEADGFIKRTVYPEVPPRVEYELTESGETLMPLVNAIANWGRSKGCELGALVEVELDGSEMVTGLDATSEDSGELGGGEVATQGS
ncbi:helix-turn-helix domain-containing protein [Pontibacter sp. G13]|uniref:winged helix-turn-helix transcriptional regulator n=1 Tax=Pontibacter sp. G13 TaxID=3074898 RepID=UPI00288B344C|nr:helix-turn-helix domain-containing protein [Pontibacter sp. G13]WNJ16652.1 helix-turn-helix domain-containing protein [Pontibacter sp. G13]